MLQRGSGDQQEEQEHPGLCNSGTVRRQREMISALHSLHRVLVQQTLPGSQRGKGHQQGGETSAEAEKPWSWSI